MEGGGTGEDKRKISFGFSVADDQKIKLIDILSEDDEFLVASPFCDSLEDSFSGVLDPDELSFINKGFRKTDAHLVPGTQDVRKRRSGRGSTPNGDDFSLDWFEIEPSIYKPKSRKVLNVAYRSPESGLRQEVLQNVQALKEVDKSFRNKMKSFQTFTGKSINIQNKESSARGRQGKVSSPKPQKALGRLMHNSKRSNNRELSGKSNVKMEYKSATTGSGQGLIMKKKSASQSSSTLNSGSRSSPKFSSIVSPTAAVASNVPVPLIDMSIGGSSAQASSILKRKIESRKSLSASLSTSKIWRHAERSKRMGNISLSTRSLSLSNHPSCPSPASSTGHWSSESLSSSVGSKQRSNGSKIGVDIKKTFGVPFLHNDAKEASDMQSPLSFPRQSGTCSVGSLSSKNFRPSGLRPPSPQIRFFDENTPPRYHGITRSRKMSQKVLSEGTSFGANTQFGYSNSELLPDSSISSRHASACKKLKSPFSEAAKNIKRPKTDHTIMSLVTYKGICLETGTVGDLGKLPRNTLGLNSSFEEEKRRDVLKNKRCRESHGPKDTTGIHTEVVNSIKKPTDQENGKKNPSCSEDKLGNLSRYFEAIDLNQEKVTELKKKQTDWNSKHNKNDRENHGMPAYSLLKQENQLLDSPMASSKPCQLSPPSVTAAASIWSTRTPLADKTSTCNFSGTFALPMQPKKEKLVQKASSVDTSSLEASDKENNQN
ncbi:hypothetical protein Pfo_015698 [Paulownia fortunei]|nr:hypothetical protein Pfo_015698 [Paulownia fortunei]